jgi:hypothetical protein
MRFAQSRSGSGSSEGMQVFKRHRLFLGHIFLLGIALLLSACIAPLPREAPVSSPVPGIAETIIFETAAAARTQTAQSLPPTRVITNTPTPSKTPTQSPSPTSTVLFLLRTDTPVVLPTLMSVSLSGSGSGSGELTKTPNPNEHDYTGTLRCAVVGQDPPDGTVFRTRKKFTMVWTIKNTGTAAWRKHTIDYRYIGGDKFHDKARYNMNFVVDPGETIEMDLEMYAPKEPGNYKTVWAVGLNTGSMCTMTLSIVVK